MSRIPRSLLIQCCKELAARNDNCGSWVGGKCPACMWEVAEIYNQGNEVNAITFAEHVVTFEAAMLVARELTE